MHNKCRLVNFTILDDHNAYKGHNPEGNYKPFVDEFAAKKEDNSSMKDSLDHLIFQEIKLRFFRDDSVKKI